MLYLRYHTYILPKVVLCKDTVSFEYSGSFGTVDVDVAITDHLLCQTGNMDLKKGKIETFQNFPGNEWAESNVKSKHMRL